MHVTSCMYLKLHSHLYMHFSTCSNWWLKIASSSMIVAKARPRAPAHVVPPDGAEDWSIFMQNMKQNLPKNAILHVLLHHGVDGLRSNLEGYESNLLIILIYTTKLYALF